MIDATPAPERSIQAPPAPDDSTASPPMFDERLIAGSMFTEEPDGWDLAPQDIHDPRCKRHPRPDGVGGLIPAKDVHR